MKKLLSIALLIFTLSAHSQQKHFFIFSKMNGTITLEDGSSTDFWGFGNFVPSTSTRPTLPGPTMIVDEGDSVFVHFRNLSMEMHTIHLHGLDVDQVNDGVPQTSFMLNFNDSTIYRFRADYPGAYLYHCHVMTVHHLAMGMYGMIVVRNAPNPQQVFDSGPGFNKEYLFLASEMDRSWNANPISPGPFQFYDADYFMINGLSGSQIFADTNNIIETTPGDSVLLRLGNMGYGYQRYSFPPGLNAKVYMSDGRPIPNPFSSDTLRIYPGERFEVMLKPTAVINDYITVDYHNSNNEIYMGTNLIGVNMYAAPAGIDDHAVFEPLKVWPNPVSDLLQVNVREEGLNMSIYSADGKLVQKGTLSKGSNSIGTACLPAGLYILYCGKTHVRFVVIR